MSRDWTMIPEYIEESITDWLKHYKHKMKSKRGFYVSQSKKEMEQCLHEAAEIMKDLKAEIRYMEN